MIVRGRRRIGKSALVEEFIEQQRVPSVFYTAEIGFGGEPLREFSEAVRVSALPDASVFAEAVPGNWAAALRQLGGVLPNDQPSIVVLDELPYLMDPDGAFESVLQRSWDRELSRKPVLLILVGSDLSMMEALTSYGRPFHQRGTQLRVGPLNPADIAAMAGLPAAVAFDAALVTGGLPIICARWRHGEGTPSFLARELANPVSQLVVSAQLSLAAEFPDDAEVAYQTAWVHDVLGLEAEAVPFYEHALAGDGLSEEDRRGARLGHASTLRTLGRYPEAVAAFRPLVCGQSRPISSRT